MSDAVAVTLIFYQLFPRVLRKPLFGGSFDKRLVALDSKVVIGSAIFGIEWGVSGVCPSAAIAALGMGKLQGNLVCNWYICRRLSSCFLE